MLDTNLLQIATVIFTHKLLTFWEQLLPSSEWLLPTRRPQGEQQFVVAMTQLVGALISVHNTLALLMNLDSLPDPPCSSVRLTGDDCCLIPVDNMIFHFWTSISNYFCFSVFQSWFPFSFIWFFISTRVPIDRIIRPTGHFVSVSVSKYNTAAHLFSEYAIAIMTIT